MHITALAMTPQDSLPSTCSLENTLAYPFTSFSKPTVRKTMAERYGGGIPSSSKRNQRERQ